MDRAESLELISKSFRHRPQPEGILIGCALILTGIAVIFVLLHMSSVLVPLSFAVFLAFLVEPMLAAIVWAPANFINGCSRVCRRFRQGRQGNEQETSFDEEASTQTEEQLSGHNVEAPPRRSEETCECSILWVRLQQTWDVISILLCVGFLLAVLAAVAFGFYTTLDSFDWSQYSDSSKLQRFQAIATKLGINETSWQTVLERYRGEMTSVASGVLGVVGNVVVTLLLFFFCLVALLPGIKQRMPQSRMRKMMSRYLLCKTLTSLIISIAVMMSLWAMGVDLVFLFGVVTFLLNFIPSIGSFLSILAPAPLVFLTPGKTINDVIMVIVVPFIIHNSLGCTVEPQLMQAGLDLHPLTVVVALTFWGAMWGASGMVLAVPITCALRLWLAEVDHPYARNIHLLFDQPLASRKTTSDLEASAASPAGSRRVSRQGLTE